MALNSLHNTVAARLVPLGRGGISKYCEPTLDGDIINADPLRRFVQPAPNWWECGEYVVSRTCTSRLSNHLLSKSRLQHYLSAPVLHQEYISMPAAGHHVRLSKMSPNVPYILGRNPYFMEMNNSLALKVSSAVARLEKRAERLQMTKVHPYFKV